MTRKKPVRHKNNDRQFRKLTALIKKEFIELTSHITKKTKLIMATLQEVKAEFTALKTVIAEERAQALEKLAALQQAIDNLTGSIAGGGTAEERDAFIVEIQAAKDEIKAIIPDA